MASARFVSVDVLRGFDMVIILGVDVLAYRLAGAIQNPWTEGVASLFRHAEWVGFTPYDLVFPLFIFLAGVSIGLGEKTRGTSAPLKKAARRAGIFLVLGVIYNFGWDWSPDRFRLPSVLFLIGMSGLAATWVSVLTDSARLRLAFAAGALLILTGLQYAMPVPGFGPAVLTPEGSVNGWIDRWVLPGRLYGDTYDPEGVLSLLAGAAMATSGLVVGRILADAVTPRQAAMRLARGGGVALVLGVAAAFFVPPIKKIWTLSFDLMAIGSSALLLAACVLLFDGARVSSQRLSWITAVGANAIVAYMGSRFLIYPLTWQWSAELNPWAGVALVAVLLAVQMALLQVLFRHQIFFRV
ncbi:MAG: hypothetical protein AAGA39_06500 [Pseudomonadota bacterium]